MARRLQGKTRQSNLPNSEIVWLNKKMNLLQGEWINMKHVDFWQYVYYILELATRKPSYDHQKYLYIIFLT